MKMNRLPRSHTMQARALCLAFAALWAFGNDAGAADRYASCDNFLPERRSVSGQEVGPESCLMQQAEVAYAGRTFVRVDLGLNGTAEGYVKMEGPYHEYVTNGPDLTFKQAGTPGERRLAVVHYERLRGTAVLLMYPKSKADWNGKLWVTAHGRGRSFRNGSLKIWDRYYDKDDPMAPFDKIHRVMLSKGYALAVTNRTSEQDVGELVATLDDGTVVDWAAFNDTSSIIKDFAAVAEAVLRKRLGKAPGRTYLYGHSAGARIGRSLNYTPGLNADARGNPVFDGFLLDDSATGLWLPVLMKNGKDVLFATDAEKSAFRPQIELVHTMYNKVWVRAPERPDWVSNSYVANKRNNAKILMNKGLGSKFRMYEIEQMSHNGGEKFPPDNRHGKMRVLDVSLVIDGAIDMLDALVEGTGEPAPSRSNWAPIGDADGDGQIENAAIQYPEVACPLGVFYPYPKMGAGTTAFAAFTGEGVEPLDETNVFVDMNRNAVWDFRETSSQAWQRLGLLNPGEHLTRERYVQCIREAATRLQKDGFFSQATVDKYVQQAQVEDLTPSTD